MNHRAITVLITLLVLLVIGTYFALKNGDDVVIPGSGVGTSTNNGKGTTPTTVENSMIRVVVPSSNALVSNPLAIAGEARGNWYFEASFPAKILDANGRVLGQMPIQAQGEWMTTDFVPFRASLSFATSTTATGFLVLEKDNPSGLPENAAEVRIPIRFSQVGTTQTRVAKLYFYNQNADKDASGNVFCSAKGLVPVNHTIPFTNTPIQDAVRELLEGPAAAERAQFPGTEFPLAGVNLAGASNSNGVLTLTFNDPQNKTSGGSCRVSILRAQIEATAKQFGGVTSVRLMPSTVFQP